ncbi:hypothetical protein NCS57_00457400 [Fusarium keratoplasticum]|uniref:Uncharacterized protein n=1 Tax=Fusarium keratoplasticum TaxID=1328300 RepID=A0ACC0R5V6_9HYPO|nr:hypothetical protein NCS57_00457400 [Fusarium keratoplasticum]KAI8675558.1 hypothetical protein NCS57_00457400 [Fusarium keratoplasticum]
MPQIIKNYRRHSTDGLHPLMYLSWAFAGIPLGVYNVVQNLNVALQVQPHILIFLSLVTWSQCKYYQDKWALVKILLVCLATASIIGGVEAGLYFPLRCAWERGIEWPMTLMAILAAVLLGCGVLRYYWEIYQSRSVKGISFLFVFIDAGGDVVSILALAFAPRIDILGIVIYSVEAVLWVGIGILGIHFRFRGWLLDKTGRKSDGLDGTPAESNMKVGESSRVEP